MGRSDTSCQGFERPGGEERWIPHVHLSNCRAALPGCKGIQSLVGSLPGCISTGILVWELMGAARAHGDQDPLGCIRSIGVIGRDAGALRGLEAWYTLVV